MDSFDVIIIGGGIAGLWSLAQARAQGLNAILFEADSLGGKQTVRSQGIIHGGSKYALQGSITGATQAIAQMPERWQSALRGEGTVDLSRTQVLAEHQFLVPGASIDTKLLSFFGSKTMRSFTQKTKSKHMPEAYQTLQIKQSCFKLFEPVLHIPSLIDDLYQQFQDRIFQASIRPEDIEHHKPGVTLSIHAGDTGIKLKAHTLLITAGEGFQALNNSASGTNVHSQCEMQTRPLQMLYASSSEQSCALPPIYAHFIGRSSKPLLTITSHPNTASNKANDYIWYLGGNIAEDGVKLSQDALISEAKGLLKQVLPSVNSASLNFDSFFINRAEPKQGALARPDDAFVARTGAIITAWPTKLALAPRLADQAIDEIQQVINAAEASPSKTGSTEDSANDESLQSALTQLAVLPKPELAQYPWQQ